MQGVLKARAPAEVNTLHSDALSFDCHQTWLRKDGYTHEQSGVGDRELKNTVWEKHNAHWAGPD